jgi:hypothetical protein
MSNHIIKTIGVYSDPDSHGDVKMIEILVDCPPHEFDVAGIVQPENEVPKDNWQTAYDERYLNSDGTEVIGEGMLSVPKQT